MAFPRIGGAGIPYNLGAAVTNAITLAAGEMYQIPAGTFAPALGQYTSLQWLDPVTNIYRTVNAASGLVPRFIDSDGGNWRLANLTGCPIGALITNAGSGLTNGFGTVTITPASGTSVWKSVVGGAINTSVTITASGSSYTYAPTLTVQAPPQGGIQATMFCTVSTGGNISAVTVTNQGAGYTTVPLITVTNDPRDTTGSGGVLTVFGTLAGSGTLTAMYPTDPGAVVTGVPTFTFSPASSIAATCICNFTITAATMTTVGSSYTSNAAVLIMSNGGIVAGTRATNTAGPIADTGLTTPRQAVINNTVNTAGQVASAGNVIVDAGFGFQAIPSLVLMYSGVGIPTVNAVPATPTVGGTTDTSFLQPV